MNYVFTDIFCDKGCLENKTYVKTGFKTAEEFLKDYIQAEKENNRVGNDSEADGILLAFERLKHNETARFIFAQRNGDCEDEDSEEEEDDYDYSKYCILIITAV